MNLEEYFDRCKELSLTARVTIELLAFERFCRDQALRVAEIEETIEYLWCWFDETRRGDFSEWEQSRPPLVDSAIEHGLTPSVLEAAQSSGVLRPVVEMLSAICRSLWGNFWGGADNNATHIAFREFFSSYPDMWRPSLTPFKHSRFASADGWGYAEADDVEYWRSMRHHT